MFEYYFRSIGLVSASVCFKDISDFIVDAMIEDQTMSGAKFKELYKAVNAGDTTLFGVELAFQRDLGFIPAAQELRYLHQLHLRPVEGYAANKPHLCGPQRRRHPAAPVRPSTQ
ncbi:MAG: hypothetical protein V8Q28_00490 [Alistipes sp.]